MPRRRATQAPAWLPAPNGRKCPVRIDRYGQMWTSITRDGQEHLAVSLKEVAQTCRVPDYYDIPPTKGTEVFDVTAYHPHQRTWGKDRERRPDILFQYQRTGYQTSSLEALLDPSGKIVLDEDNYPVRHFPVLPLTISTEVEGWRLEAWHRMDSRIQYNDIRARMLLRWRAEKGKTGPLLSTFNQRKSRDRQQMRCLAWPKTGQPKEKTGNFDVLLRAEMTDAMKAQNSTKGLPDLTNDEFTAVSDSGYGTGLPKAGKKALSAEVRDDRWKSAAILADENGEIPPIDPAKYHQRWIQVRGCNFLMIKAKPNAEISESTVQGPSTVPNPLNPSTSNGMHGSQSVFPIDTRPVADKHFHLVQGPSSSHAGAYLGNLGPADEKSHQLLPGNSSWHVDSQAARSTNDYPGNHSITAARPGRRWAIFADAQPSSRISDNGDNEGYSGRSHSSGDDSSRARSPNRVQHTKKRRLQEVDQDDDENQGLGLNTFDRLLLSVAHNVSQFHRSSSNATASGESQSRRGPNLAAVHKRQKILASDVRKGNMGNMRNNLLTHTPHNLIQRQRHSTTSSGRPKGGQSSHADLDSRTQTGFNSRPLMQTWSHEAYGIDSQLQDQENRQSHEGFNHDTRRPHHTTSAGFNSGGSLQPHASDSAHSTQSGDFEAPGPNLEYSNCSRHYAANATFQIVFPNISSPNQMHNIMDPLTRQRQKDQMHGSQAGYFHPREPDQVEHPRVRQTCPAPGESISPHIPGQASYTDANGFENMDLFEPPQPDEDSVDEWKTLPPGQYPSLDDAMGHSVLPEATGVNRYSRHDPRNRIPEQDQSPQPSDNDIFAVYTIDAEWVRGQAPYSNPADPIVEGNLAVMEVKTRSSSSTIPVQHSRSSDERERAPWKDAEPAASVDEVDEPTTQFEGLSQPHPAGTVIADPDVEQHGSMSPLYQLTKAGIGETAVNGEQSSLSETAGQRQRTGHNAGDFSSSPLGSTEEGGWQEEWNDALGELPRTPPPWNAEWDQPRALLNSSPLPPDATEEEVDALVKEYEDQNSTRQ